MSANLSDILGEIRDLYAGDDRDVLDIGAYLEACREDRSYCATAAERIVAAFGEPQVIDTSRDPRLGRLFGNSPIRLFEPFSDFYGLEQVIETVWRYFVHAAQGLEERKQILYLLGPVGGGKSSIAERLKSLVERRPIWVLGFRRDDGTVVTSPVFESPLGIFDAERHGRWLEETWKIPRRYAETVPSPWAVKRLREFGGDLSRVCAVKMWPSRVRQIAVAKTEPGDDTNQDVSSLVGKVDLRRLDELPRNDPDAYAFSGALCRGNRGIVEFVEMFKAPLKTLHPLLTATQERNYVGTEEIGAIPFEGVILAHSNESEWQQFRSNPRNEAFLDRVYVVRVPYVLRWSEEVKIYRKMLSGSSLSEAPVAPHTIELLAKWSVTSRLTPPPRGSMLTKLRVYDGENVSEVDPKAMTIDEYRAEAGREEGMSGMSTRFAFKVLAWAFNAGLTGGQEEGEETSRIDGEIGADPVLLFAALRRHIEAEHLPKEREEALLGHLQALQKEYASILEKDLQRAYVENFEDYAQSVFENYVAYAQAWLDQSSYRDPTTGTTLSPEELAAELDKLEKPVGIANPRSFRQDVVNYFLRQRAAGCEPRWNSYAKIRDVIERRVFASMEELLPVISFGPRRDMELENKHRAFVDRMRELGYTPAQTRRVVEWYMRMRHSSN